MAEFRAEENRELHHLYRDPIVPLFLDEETGKAVFELDDENILAFKKARLEESGNDAKVRVIPGNYVRDGLIDLLKISEFDFERFERD